MYPQFGIHLYEHAYTYIYPFPFIRTQRVGNLDKH